MKESSFASSNTTKESTKLGGFLFGAFRRSVAATASNKSSASTSNDGNKGNKATNAFKKSPSEHQTRDRTLRASPRPDKIKTANGRSRLLTRARAKSIDVVPLQLQQRPISLTNQHGSNPDLSPRKRSSRSVAGDINPQRQREHQRCTLDDRKRAASQERLIDRLQSKNHVQGIINRQLSLGNVPTSSRSTVVQSPWSRTRAASAHELLQSKRANNKPPYQRVPHDDSSSSEEDFDVDRSLFSSAITKSTGTRSIPHRQASTAKRPLSKQSASPVSSTAIPNLDSDDPEAWFRAIGQRDWVSVERLIESYDYKKYHRPADSNATTPPFRTPSKKLRVLKYFPNKSFDDDPDDVAGQENDLISPLLQVDSEGRTALHLACKDFMPWKLLQSLFFLERCAATIVDKDGRVPLHHALISNHDTKILNRLIHANATDLLLPDALSRTPLGYAILRAEFKRDKSVQGSWRTATTNERRDWQTQQTENWKHANFLLDSLVARRKLLSKVHEKSLLLDAVNALAPPSVINSMLSVSARILQQDHRMVKQLLQLLVERGYPITIFQKTLKICSETIPQTVLLSCIRNNCMMAHYDFGCVVFYRRDIQQETSFRTEILQEAYKRTQRADGDAALLVPTVACQEWWDMLKFFVGYSSSASLTTHTLDEIYLLHATLMIPNTPISLVELFVRLFPSSRHVPDPQTDSLPIHLACRICRESDVVASQILNLIVDGDSKFARRRCRRRYPLHLAVLAQQRWSFVKTIVALRPKLVNAIDPWTRLYPFQLAAMNKAYVTTDRPNSDLSPNRKTCDGNEDGQLDVVFELLRMNPVNLSPLLSCGSGNPAGDLGPVAQHVLSWCYVYKKPGWVLDTTRFQQLRSAISSGLMPQSMLTWFENLKLRIWQVYDRKNAGKIMAHMPRDDIFLLHAAISNGGTPPIAIELLLELFPDSITTPIPGTNQYPAHIAAENHSYYPMPFETIISMTSVLEMLVLAHPRAVHLESNGRNVLQIAIDSGKTWSEIGSIVLEQPSLLVLRDKTNLLLPFQHIASEESYMPLQDLMHAKTIAMKWTDRTPAENGLFLLKLKGEYQLEKLSAIFKMLRTQPKALQACMP